MELPLFLAETMQEIYIDATRGDLPIWIQIEV